MHSVELVVGNIRSVSHVSTNTNPNPNPNPRIKSGELTDK